MRRARRRRCAALVVARGCDGVPMLSRPVRVRAEKRAIRLQRRKTSAEARLAERANRGASERHRRPPRARREPRRWRVRRQLDLTLSDAAQDLGFTLDLSERASQDDRELGDLEVIARAAKGTRWVVYPSIEMQGSDMVVRLVGVAPGSKVAVVRTEVVKASELAVSAVVMLRDVLAVRPPRPPANRCRPALPSGSKRHPRSPYPPARRVEACCPSTARSSEASSVTPCSAAAEATIRGFSFRSWPWVPDSGSALRRSSPRSGTSGSAMLGTCRQQRGGRLFRGSFSRGAASIAIRPPNTASP